LSAASGLGAGITEGGGGCPGSWAHAKPRRREGRRTRAVVSFRFLEVSLASRGRESAGVCFRSSGFQARDLSRRDWNACRPPLGGWEAVWRHAKPRSREAAKGGGEWRFSSTSASTVRQGGLSTSTKGGLWGIMFLRFSCSCSNLAHSVPGSPGGDYVARAFQPEHSGV